MILNLDRVLIRIEDAIQLREDLVVVCRVILIYLIRPPPLRHDLWFFCLLLNRDLSACLVFDFLFHDVIEEKFRDFIVIDYFGSVEVLLRQSFKGV